MWILIFLILGTWNYIPLHHKRFEVFLILLEDKPVTNIKPHAEDPGTPELIALQLPKNAIDRKTILRKHRETKLVQQNGEIMVDHKKDMVVPKAELRQSSPKPKAKSSSSSSRAGIVAGKTKVKTTALKKSKEICFFCTKVWR